MIKRFFIIAAIILLPSVAAAVKWNPEDVLRLYLKDNYPWEEIEFSALKASAELPNELPERIVLEKGPPGRTVFLLKFRNGRKVTVTTYVKAFDRVVMSRRPFRKGHHIERDDVYMTLMDVMRIPKGAVKDQEAVVGRVLARSVVANMPIVESMVRETPLVKKGRKVVLLVESSNFSIEMMGELKENGYIGSYVRAVNPVSKKVITGLLVDENTVRVRF
jgi:flagella basal body P-ring formation protein FlgA